jgi:hypothetical protein
MKLFLKIIFILVTGTLMAALAGCASGPSNVHYGASVHYSTGWGGYYGGHRPPHYRPPPSHRPPGNRPPSRPPGGGSRPTQLPSRR